MVKTRPASTKNSGANISLIRIQFISSLDCKIKLGTRQVNYGEAKY